MIRIQSNESNIECTRDVINGTKALRENWNIRRRMGYDNREENWQCSLLLHQQRWQPSPGLYSRNVLPGNLLLVPTAIIRFWGKGVDAVAERLHFSSSAMVQYLLQEDPHLFSN